MSKKVDEKPKIAPKVESRPQSGLEMRVEALEKQMVETERKYRLLIKDYQSRFSGVLIK